MNACNCCNSKTVVDFDKRDGDITFIIDGCTLTPTKKN